MAPPTTPVRPAWVNSASLGTAASPARRSRTGSRRHSRLQHGPPTQPSRGREAPRNRTRSSATKKHRDLVIEMSDGDSGHRTPAARRSARNIGQVLAVTDEWGVRTRARALTPAIRIVPFEARRHARGAAGKAHTARRTRHRRPTHPLEHVVHESGGSVDRREATARVAPGCLALEPAATMSGPVPGAWSRPVATGGCESMRLGTGDEHCSRPATSPHSTAPCRRRDHGDRLARRRNVAPYGYGWLRASTPS